MRGIQGLRLSVLGAVAIICFMLAPTTANGEILYDNDMPVRLVGGSRTLHPLTSFHLTVRIREAGDGQAPVIASVFDGLEIDISDIGRTFVATADSDPGFVQFADYITNGTNEQTHFPRGAGSSSIHNESCEFHHDCSGVSGVDLEGFIIDKVTYYVEDWYHVSSDDWTDTYYGHRMTIEGHPVPEPSALILLAVAAAALAFGWKRRKQKA